MPEKVSKLKVKQETKKGNTLPLFAPSGVEMIARKVAGKAVLSELYFPKASEIRFVTYFPYDKETVWKIFPGNKKASFSVQVRGDFSTYRLG